MPATAALNQRTVPADPTVPLQTATKSYVDANSAPLAGPTQYPSSTGSANVVGTGAAAARYDHVHADPNPAVVLLSDAATLATDCSLGSYFRVTLGGNRTLGAPTNPYDGQRCIWEFIQDATGSRTLTLNAIFLLGTDISAVTLTTTASKRDFMGAVYNSTAAKWYVVAFARGY